MSELLVLPVDLSSEGIRRLHAQLEHDIRAGGDLGPRQGQIACLSGSILRSVESLRQTILLLTVDLPEGDPMIDRLREAAGNITRLAFAVMDFAARCDAHAARAA